MDDDWRLQIDLDDDGIGGEIADHLRSAELEHDLAVDIGQRVIVSHEGERIFLYAGDRDQLDGLSPRSRSTSTGRAGRPTSSCAIGTTRSRRMGGPDAAEPTTAAEKEAEHERLMETEDEETADRRGLAEFEVGVEFPSHNEAREFAKKLKEEGLEPVRRWHYMVVGAADEDAAKELAERIRAEAPADAKVKAEYSLPRSTTSAAEPLLLPRRPRRLVPLPAPPAREVPPQRVDDRVRLAVEPRFGDPGRVDPRVQEVVVPHPVLLEGEPRPVRLVGVEFDPEARLLPVGVDLMAGDEDVHRGLR